MDVSTWRTVSVRIHPKGQAGLNPSKLLTDDFASWNIEMMEPKLHQKYDKMGNQYRIDNCLRAMTKDEDNPVHWYDSLGIKWCSPTPD